MANGSNQSDTHSPLDFFNEEMRMFVEDGEFSSGVPISDPEGNSVALSSTVSDAWKRAEKDGRLVATSPIQMPSVMVPVYRLLGAGWEPNSYRSLKVEDKGKVFSVVSYAGTDPVRLFLKGSNYNDPDPIDPGTSTDPEVPITPEPDPIPEPEF